jgi:hypothetical protein
MSHPISAKAERMSEAQPISRCGPLPIAHNQSRIQSRPISAKAENVSRLDGACALPSFASGVIYCGARRWLRPRRGT